MGRCGNGFGAWDKDGGKSVINTGPDGKQAAMRNESTTRRRPNNDGRLVVSSLPEHSADELCRDPASRGPDFVSLVEGTHCDMDTREVLPLCADGLTTRCFDLEAETAVERTPSRGVGSLDANQVIYW